MVKPLVLWSEISHLGTSHGWDSVVVLYLLLLVLSMSGREPNIKDKLLSELNTIGNLLAGRAEREREKERELQFVDGGKPSYQNVLAEMQVAYEVVKQPAWERLVGSEKCSCITSQSSGCSIKP